MTRFVWLRCPFLALSGHARHVGRCPLVIWGRGAMAAESAGTISGGDAQLLLDLGHHRAPQTRLAQFREVLNDDALP
jgi:hypothetical protein